MATWADVTRAMSGIREVEREAGARRWRVADKLLAWERPLRQSDLEALGDAAPEGPILGVRVPLEVKEALLASRKKAYFTTPHFDGYPTILVHLASIRPPALRSLLETARDTFAARKKRAQAAFGDSRRASRPTVRTEK
jgi:hypothetical protein